MTDQGIQTRAAEINALLQQITRLEAAGDARSGWLDAMGRVLTLVRSSSEAEWTALVQSRVGETGLRERLSPAYGLYLRTRELMEARALLERMAGANMGNVIGQGGAFAREAYERVADLFVHVDFSNCRRCVMVGCGPLPVTLFHILDRTTVPEVIGLDIDNEALAVASQLLQKFELRRGRVESCNGSGYDFAGADVVYVANLVQPKRAVLGRIAATARTGTQVVLRNPFAAGILLADDGLDDLDVRLRVLHIGAGNVEFLSRDVFLEVV